MVDSLASIALAANCLFLLLRLGILGKVTKLNNSEIKLYLLECVSMVTMSFCITSDVISHIFVNFCKFLWPTLKNKPLLKIGLRGRVDQAIRN